MNLPINSIYNYKVITIIAPRPVTVDDMISHLKLDPDLSTDPVFATEMESYIDAAISTCEKITKRTIQESTFTANLDSFFRYMWCYGCCNEFEIRKSPLESIDQIQYLSDGVPVTLDPTLYEYSLNNEFSILSPVYGVNWPAVDSKRQAITIDLTAGYPENEVPADLLLALKNHVAAMWSHRGDCDNGSGENSCKLPFSVKSVYKLYSIYDIRIGF